MLLWRRRQGVASLPRELLRSLLQRGRDGGKSCRGWAWMALMPQVSASTGGNSLSVQEGEEKVVLQCQLPSCLPVLSSGAQSSRPTGSERLWWGPLPVPPFLENGRWQVVPQSSFV